MGEYEAPRDLIQLVDGAKMVELENNKERALMLWSFINDVL